MTTTAQEILIQSETALQTLAQCVLLKCRAGDTIALSGDLGAGKTTFARALIRAALEDLDAEVPSPTFAIEQIYDSPRFHIHHFDLYRISDPEELIEIGFTEPRSDALSLIEWPDHAGGLLPAETVGIEIAETGDATEERLVRLTANGAAGKRLASIGRMLSLIERTCANDNATSVTVRYLQGDASTRSYGRLSASFGSRILMDFPRQPDGPPVRDGLAYSKIAHLAEDISPFIAIGDSLRRKGFSAPQLFGADIDAGLAVFEDFGDTVFGTALADGLDQTTLWQAAVDGLLAMHNTDWPDLATADSGLKHLLPIYDDTAMQIEVELLADWYVPWRVNQPLASETHQAFIESWSTAFALLDRQSTTWVLRDYHSPNLIWLPQRVGIQRVGLLDFQDAQIGHPAYDLVSLLQDARLDVAIETEATLYDHYISRMSSRQPNFDTEKFRCAYALLGAQRNTKILGIFARLAVRDGKPQYLQHIPRIRRYLARNLGHPALDGLKKWYDTHLPEAA